MRKRGREASSRSAASPPALAVENRRRWDWWLVGIFVGCSLLAAVLVCRAREWSVMTDELLYTEMARGMLGTGLPLPNVRGEYVQVYQVLYPLLIAPVIWIVGMPEAYQAIAAVNAVAITSACVPAYLLANYVTEDRVLARWVALCVGVLPWVVFATKILTDSLAYPLFVWALYAVVRAVAEGGADRRRDWIALGAIAAAYFARSQFVVLPAIFCATLVGRELASGICRSKGSNGARIAAGLRAALRAPLDRLPVFVTAMVVVAMVVLKPTWILGIYSATTSSDFGSVVPTDLIGQIGSHLGMIALGVGVVPLLLSASWITVALARPSDARQNSAALAFAISSLVLLFVAASFDVRFSRTEEVYERYIFYLAPILLIGAAAFFKHPPKHWAGFMLPALAALLIFARDDHYGLDDEITVSLSHAFKPLRIFEIALQKVVDGSGFLPSVTTAVAISAALLAGGVWLAIARDHARRAAGVCFALVFAFCMWATLYVVPRGVDEQNRAGDARFGMRAPAQKLWIDEFAVGRHVSLVYNSINYADDRPVDVFGGEQPVFWDAEFWNESVRSFYTPFADRGAINAAMPPYHRLRVRFADGSIRLTGGEPAALWLMSDSDPRFAPLPTSSPMREHFSGLTIYPVPASPRADWASRGLTYQGFVPRSAAASLRVYADPAGSAAQRVRVRLVFERKRLSGAASQLGVREGLTDNSTVSRARSLCLPAGGATDIDLHDLTRDLTGPRHVARLLRVRVARGGGGCTAD